ncbi:hypothetical protein QR680_014118 [Steinernema hermaphroditum]|uniref:NADAR domain-containing protein n=1 Tax=Steinernema hermaphroditum TaxID=289476 RepID=A0AA39M2N4_9BILA|nr:hypothetical protein QR680_014118 [Steinernema hermaphroditum]
MDKELVGNRHRQFKKPQHPAGAKKRPGSNNNSIKSAPSSEVSLPKNTNGSDSQITTLSEQLSALKNELASLRTQLADVVEDKNNLVTAVRKLKTDGVHTKLKLAGLHKKLSHMHVNVGGSDTESEEYPPEAQVDYDEIGRSRDFILVGAGRDPFALRFEVNITDPESGRHFMSAECYYLYKMAEHFGDKAAMEILASSKTSREALDLSDTINNFSEKEWEKVKLGYWIAAQKLKFDQNAWINKLLVATGTTYIAVASQDKIIGTGWRITRDEACRVAFWEGQNLGGKAIMKIRQELKGSIEWKDDAEQKTFERKVLTMKRFVWRRQDQTTRARFVNRQARHQSVGAPQERDAHTSEASSE